MKINQKQPPKERYTFVTVEEIHRERRHQQRRGLVEKRDRDEESTERDADCFIVGGRSRDRGGIFEVSRERGGVVEVSREKRGVIEGEKERTGVLEIENDTESSRFQSRNTESPRERRKEAESSREKKREADSSRERKTRLMTHVSLDTFLVRLS
ncbi:hypothetical protein F2Q69_00026739 [Brassica cretica]|uniref:Uncharacterized protein n=1 Tax=Brassica cretica TaxID=69181 RepID=A0A8S9RYB9_BRACR|nr:hypothetical protein F2Q69_00026739 [Brassica cretica]